MNKDVIVTEDSVEIKPINLKVKYSKEGFEIIFQGNTKLMVDGNFYLGSTGEMGIMTKDKNINFDSLGEGQVHFNSRISKPLKDLPESIDFRNKSKQRAEENRKHVEQHHKEKVHFQQELLEVIGDLRKRVGELENG